MRNLKFEPDVIPLADLVPLECPVDCYYQLLINDSACPLNYSRALPELRAAIVEKRIQALWNLVDSDYWWARLVSGQTIRSDYFEFQIQVADYPSEFFVTQLSSIAHPFSELRLSIHTDGRNVGQTYSHNDTHTTEHGPFESFESARDAVREIRGEHARWILSTRRGAL